MSEGSFHARRPRTPSKGPGPIVEVMLGRVCVWEGEGEGVYICINICAYVCVREGGSVCV